MPRAARLDVPDGLFHVISRAIDRHALFDGPTERARYLELLGRALRHTDARVLAWCIMSNHVHLVVQAGQQPLWRLMKAVHVGYAMWKNRRDGRIGPLFAERYKAILVDREEYLVDLVRYVHLNPVRARVVARPEDSTWSSHRAYLGLDPQPAWLHSTDVLGLFGTVLAGSRQAFASFVTAGIGEERSPVLSGDERLRLASLAVPMFGDGYRPSDAIVGSEEFVARTMSGLHRASTGARVRDREGRERARPAASRLADLVCDVLALERTTFDAMPQARGPARARQILAHVWVDVYRGPRIALARELRVRSEQVTRWHHRYLEQVDALHEDAQAVEARLDALESQIAREQRLVERAAPGLAKKPRGRVSVNLEVADE
jgi:REP element-mobilizing transposase RayT